ncbi:MAG TPA: thiamine-phosphate kinase [Candidatus Acidoferrum sp.]|nr:thiamine-phosphate kinase [Candidatus Acidoferrum sp.]
MPSQVGGGGSRYGLALGIGDDAALLRSYGGEEWVISCDAFVEGVHFLADIHPADSVGYKALVRAASDLVAMGASPRLFLLTLALPKSRSGRWLDKFLAGLRRAANYLNMRLAGGDTTAGAKVSISVAVLGQIGNNVSHGVPRSAKGRSGHCGTALTRSGGRAGDRIYVSGTLGRAQIGLELVRRMKKRVVRMTMGPLPEALKAHFYPRLRVDLGKWLARNGVASAMMDLSDGLSTDLVRLCHASGVGARLWAERIPVVSPSPEILTLLPRSFDPLKAALNGGDDYELLFTVPKRNDGRLRGAPDSPELTCIGELSNDKQILLADTDGGTKPLTAGGWDPFRK